MKKVSILFSIVAVPILIGQGCNSTKTSQTTSLEMPASNHENVGEMFVEGEANPEAEKNMEDSEALMDKGEAKEEGEDDTTTEEGKLMMKKEENAATTNPIISTPIETVKTFNITAKQWSFEPSSITVNKGDKVKITVTSLDVAHGLTIPDFGVNEKLIPGETTNLEFTADKSGTFSFFCSVFCGSDHGSMSGTLIVN